MVKKPYKLGKELEVVKAEGDSLNLIIVKSKLFKEQEKHLSSADKKGLSKALKEIAKDPHNVKGSMSLFAEPTAEELMQWCNGDWDDEGGIEEFQVDFVLEYLGDKGCLNKKGKKLQREFWEKYIEEKDD